MIKEARYTDPYEAEIDSYMTNLISRESASSFPFFVNTHYYVIIKSVVLRSRDMISLYTLCFL